MRVRPNSRAKASAPAPKFLSVYDGREIRGFILARSKLGFEAFDCKEESLGLFRTLHEAATAISPEAAP